MNRPKLNGCILNGAGSRRAVEIRGGVLFGVDTITGMGLTVRYAGTFLPALYALQWFTCRQLGIPFAFSADVVGFAIVAFGFGAIGLGAAAVYAGDGAFPSGDRARDKSNFVERSRRYLAKGPFQPLARPELISATMYFLPYFYCVYMSLWVLTSLGLPRVTPGFAAYYEPSSLRVFAQIFAMLALTPALAAVIASSIVMRSQAAPGIADEVRHIQRCAAQHKAEFVTIRSVAIFSTNAGDAWLLDPEDHLAARVASKGDPEPTHVEKTDTNITIGWKGHYRIEDQVFIYIDRDPTVPAVRILGYPTARIAELG